MLLAAHPVLLLCPWCLLIEALGYFSTCSSAKMAACPLVLYLYSCPWPWLPGHDRCLQVNSSVRSFLRMSPLAATDLVRHMHTCWMSCAKQHGYLGMGLGKGSCHKVSPHHMWNLECQNPSYLAGRTGLSEGMRKVQDSQGCQVIMQSQVNTDHGIAGITVNLLQNGQLDGSRIWQGWDKSM